ncbi:MAG: sigma-70 family RNA polymerase sigma factor [Cyclobacteriaceae bacterium]
MTTTINLSADQILAKQERADDFIDIKQQLLSFIKSRIPDRDDAEDILQDVYIQMETTSEPIQQLSGWLYRVARNKIIDRFRKKKPESFSRMSDESSIQSKASLTNAAPEEVYMNKLIWDSVNNALAQLPEEQRQAYVLNEFEGLSFQQISEVTGEKVNTLISRKHYAIKHLRKQLQGLYDEL